MGEASTIDLFDGWRATFEPVGDWLGVRLHPPAGGGQWQLAEGLWREIHRRGALQVVLEMDEITFFSSALMSELVRVHKRVAMAGGRLRLSGLQKHPHEALHLMRLDEVLPIFRSRDEAIQ
ncbi:hypothetical protein Pla108_10270 [Botrimarina colliarenosi]|uniref:STAS domain-containing protein n=1 Tax=Botrimarina colliarenosi TaxID=2528001 RepID=A0A5C6AJ62_9BACT|nr:STAS domain-containing protein [Botrimarina colliarenosi]TWU00083.1 hypothetical protein Pla108_10270 [Botrimarina colliarenosi]